MPHIGFTELLLVLLVVLILFGAKRIPELARGLGRGIREFKDATKEDSDSQRQIDSQKESDEKQK
ncbi:MAG TPA: twin-arginine translocase TatA/TatE family subunit [bacterium]